MSWQTDTGWRAGCGCVWLASCFQAMTVSLPAQAADVRHAQFREAFAERLRMLFLVLAPSYALQLRKMDQRPQRTLQPKRFRDYYAHQLVSSLSEK